MPTIVATKAYPYGTRKLKVGDRFEATERDADLLVKVGMAKPVEAKPTKVATVTVAADVTSEPVKPKRRYRRKDLQAEE
jgi:hypothetical protein